MAFKWLNHWTVPFLSVPCFKLVSLEDGIHSSGVSGVRKWCFLAICTGRFFEYVAMTFFLVVPNSVQSLLPGALDLPAVQVFAALILSSLRGVQKFLNCVSHILLPEGKRKILAIILDCCETPVIRAPLPLLRH